MSLMPWGCDVRIGQGWRQDGILIRHAVRPGILVRHAVRQAVVCLRGQAVVCLRGQAVVCGRSGFAKMMVWHALKKKPGKHLPYVRLPGVYQHGGVASGWWWYWVWVPGHGGYLVWGTGYRSSRVHKWVSFGPVLSTFWPEIALKPHV